MKTKILRFLACVTLILAVNMVSINHIFASGTGPGTSWLYYRVITLSTVTPAANFQVKVSLAAGEYTNMKSDGSDLRFYDKANNNCEYWIETWNTSGASVIWVKVPTSGSDILVLYYGNASASAASNGSQTFDFFDDFTGSSLGSNWQQTTSNGTITVSGGAATLSCNSNSGSVYLSSAFSPNSTSFFLEAKNKESAYYRNRSYACATLFGANPLGFDNGYFYNGTVGAKTSGQVFWNSTWNYTVTANVDYITRWQITDGSTYNWYTLTYADGTIRDTRTATTTSSIRYITFGVTEAAGTATIVDWVRVRQYAATEPVSTLGSQASNTTASTPTLFNTSGYFIVPDGVTKLTIECWGAGGRGGSRTTTGNGGGGGGGAYASSDVTVIPGGTYAVTVGTGSSSGTTPGGDSWFNSASTVMAKGGSSTADNTATGSTGGLASASIGTTKYSGGTGATGSGTYGGGGGSSAGTASAGNNGSTYSGGNAPTGGGAGGNGRNGSNGVGIGGSIPGGGGGGAYRTTGTQSGGSGANGQVKISWCVPPSAPVVTSPIYYCQNATASALTATGTGLLWYTSSTGGTGSTTAPVPSTTSVGTTSYYVSQTIGCESARAKIDVIVYTTSTSISGQSNISCYGGNDGAITILGDGGFPPYQYSVDNGVTYTNGTLPNPYTYTGLSANVQYKIRVKDSNGCQSPAIP